MCFQCTVEFWHNAQFKHYIRILRSTIYLYSNLKITHIFMFATSCLSPSCFLFYFNCPMSCHGLLSLWCRSTIVFTSGYPRLSTWNHLTQFDLYDLYTSIFGVWRWYWPPVRFIKPRLPALAEVAAAEYEVAYIELVSLNWRPLP